MQLIQLGDIGLCFFDEQLKIKDKNHEKALNIALNRINGDWDYPKLEEILQELNNNKLDLSLTGYSITDILEEENITLERPPHKTKEFTDNNIDEKTPEKTTINTDNIHEGDIYQLGRHKLICADTTKKETLQNILNNEKPSLIIIDPPYGLHKQKDGVLNDNLNMDDLLEFTKKYLQPLIEEYTNTTVNIYIWGTFVSLCYIYMEILRKYIKQQTLRLANTIVWYKEGSGPGQNSPYTQKYAEKHELCLLIQKGGFKTQKNTQDYWTGYDPLRKYIQNSIQETGYTTKQIAKQLGITDRAIAHWTTKSQWQLIPRNHYKKLQQITTKKEKQENKTIQAFKKPYNELQKQYQQLNKENPITHERPYFNNTIKKDLSDIFTYPRTHTTEKTIHPTQKPLEMYKTIIQTSSKTGDLILDPFAGSGVTLIAAEQTNRTCYTIEYNKEFIAKIIQRYEQETGIKAKKINNN